MVAAVETNEFFISRFGWENFEFFKHSRELLKGKFTWSIVILEEFVVSKS